MKYKVLVLDIDGTLNNSKKEITQKTKKAVIKAQEEGTIVVLASGRPTCGVMPVAREIELEKFGGYVLSYNGGRITNCKTGEVIYQQNILSENVPEIYGISKEYGVNILTYNGDTLVTEKLDEYAQLECRICGLNGTTVENFMDTVKYPIPKFLMTGDGDYLAKIEPLVFEKLKDRFNVFRSEPFFLEIMPLNIDKAKSLDRLLSHLKLTKHEMIACGDGFNDISMISFAGLGVAMENAQPKVKEIAKFITLSNDNDGIAHVIEKFIFNEHIA